MDALLLCVALLNIVIAIVFDEVWWLRISLICGWLCVVVVAIGLMTGQLVEIE